MEHMCNEPPCRQPFQCPPVMTNVVKQPGEYWLRSQIGCNSPEHSGPLWDKSQTLGSLLAPLRRRQLPHRTVAVGPSVGCYWKPLASQLFGSPVYSRWAPWGVFVYCRRLVKAHDGDLLVVKKNVANCHFCYQVAAAPWWLPVKGANWKHPDGPDSNITGRYKNTPRTVSFRIHTFNSKVHIDKAGSQLIFMAAHL